jgi:hypothetical protein
MDETEGNRLWVQQWQRVGPIMEKLRHEELRAMTDEQARHAFLSVADLAFKLSEWPVRTSSGFVEQQRLFLKLRKHDPAG